MNYTLKIHWLVLVFLIAVACVNKPASEETETLNSGTNNEQIPQVSLIVLGNVQDAGSPHIGCKKECCRLLFSNPDATRKVVSLGLFDAINNKKYLFEATPDITEQAKVLKEYGTFSDREMPDGIFLTHAHIGHYTGLMYLGKEAINADRVPVYAMPEMYDYLKTNGPWSQLITNNNISLKPLKADSLMRLTPNIAVKPLKVPHRDEFSETVGYEITGKTKKALFIPDIDKWNKWDRDISELIKTVDYAFLDATFFDGAEINNRDISEIPHPFIIESMKRFSSLNEADRRKIIFIHMNHTNPALNPDSKESSAIVAGGFRVARFGDRFDL